MDYNRLMIMVMKDYSKREGLLVINSVQIQVEAEYESQRWNVEGEFFKVE